MDFQKPCHGDTEHLDLASTVIAMSGSIAMDGSWDFTPISGIYHRCKALIFKHFNGGRDRD
jgi:hypothetical protein